MNPLKANPSSAFQSPLCTFPLEKPKEGGCREITSGEQGCHPGRSASGSGSSAPRKWKSHVLSPNWLTFAPAWELLGGRAPDWGPGQLAPRPSGVCTHIRAELPVGRGRDAPAATSAGGWEERAALHENK